MSVKEAPDRFVTIAYVYSQAELAVLLSLFEHENIWVVPISRGHISVQWTWTLALGGVEIRVHEADIEAALAILAGTSRELFRGHFFTDSRALDIALVVLMLLVLLVPPPARLPAFLLEDRRGAPQAA